MTTTRLLLVVLALALPGALVSGCGSGGDDEAPRRPTPAAPPASAAIARNEANAKVSLTIGSKNFTEQRVLGEIYAQGLRAAGYDVQTKLDLGDEHVALKALESGEIDAYPEYTGTALLSFFGKQPEELPKDPQDGLRGGQAGLRRSAGWWRSRPRRSPPPTRSRSPRRPRRGSRCRRSPTSKGQARELTLAGSPECRERLDCLRGLEQVYGLKFRRFMPVADPQAPRGTHLRESRRLDRLHHRSADPAGVRGPARGRQEHVRPLQLDAGDAQGDGRPGRARPSRRPCG